MARRYGIRMAVIVTHESRVFNITWRNNEGAVVKVLEDNSLQVITRRSQLSNFTAKIVGAIKLVDISDQTEILSLIPGVISQRGNWKVVQEKVEVVLSLGLYQSEPIITEVTNVYSTGRGAQELLNTHVPEEIYQSWLKSIGQTDTTGLEMTVRLHLASRRSDHDLYTFYFLEEGEESVVEKLIEIAELVNARLVSA